MRPASRSRLIVADAASALFMAAVAAAARATGIGLLLFPELGALANDILRRPRGAWARAPVMLVLTPLATGAAGVLLARHLPFGLVSVGLDVGASIVLIQWLRSPIAPAISAGLLPLVLGTTSAWYPLAISAGTATLALLSVAGRRFATGAAQPEARDRIDDLMEQPAGHAAWWLPFVLVLGALTALAQWSGQRFVLFPPLVVIGFEMFAHPRVCPWARRAWRLPLACTLAAAAGVALVGWIGHGALAAAGAMLVGTTVLRALDLHAPPVLAVGLLPLVMDVADARFVGAVLVGTLAFTAMFLGWDALQRSWRGSTRSCPQVRRRS